MHCKIFEWLDYFNIEYSGTHLLFGKMQEKYFKKGGNTTWLKVMVPVCFKQLKSSLKSPFLDLKIILFFYLLKYSTKPNSIWQDQVMPPSLLQYQHRHGEYTTNIRIEIIIWINKYYKVLINIMVYTKRFLQLKVIRILNKNTREHGYVRNTENVKTKMASTKMAAYDVRGKNFDESTSYNINIINIFRIKNVSNTNALLFLLLTSLLTILTYRWSQLRSKVGIQDKNDF